MFLLKLLAVLIVLYNHLDKVVTQTDTCTLISAILNPGKNLISDQFNTGFCREWIVGPVTKPQRIMITFSIVDINCDENDKLLVYNENKSSLLYDHCELKKNNKSLEQNYILTKAKYLIARMQTKSNRYISAGFDLILLDLPLLVTLQPPLPTIVLNTPLSQNFDQFIPEEICTPTPMEISDLSGTLNSPAIKEGFSYNSNCTWIIRAPKNQRVYIVFDFINLPNNPDARLDQFGCSNNYISIASLAKPNENYKLCGNRRGLKIITTYNNVLINFVSKSLREFGLGFALVFKVIKDPSALTSSSTTTKNPITTFTSTLAPKLNCGIPFNKPLDSVSRIIGGNEAVPHSWPWQVMITDGLIMCGGTLINNQWLVTAAHCTENINNGPIKAYLGMHNRLRSESSKIIRHIDQVIVHPNYMGRLTQWDYDIAMMKLSEPVVFSNEISPICLPPQNVNLATLGSKGFVTGWGETQGTGPAYLLRQATITVKKNNECGASSENMLCAGDKTPELHDSCQGDSGGPFFMKNNNNYFLVGIVSWGYDCNGAGVYTKVSNFVNWISSVASTN